MSIRTVSRTLEGAYEPPKSLVRKKLSKRLFGGVLKRSRKRLLRTSILAVNLLILASVVVFVLQNSRTSQSSTASSAVISSSTDAVNPLDQLSSADIAVNVARMTNIAEATSAANQADSVNALLSVSPADQTVVAKPQVVATVFKSNKDIQTYITTSGDTVSKLAARFHISSDSIRASNGITGDQLTSGQSLYIPPFNGIVYIVRSGDTPASLASKFNSNKDQIIAFNDAEITGLTVGTRIIIPNGQLAPSPVGPGPGAFVGSFAATYGGNGYDYGFCTWYVANRVPVPTNWGNAYTWAIYAAQSGWNVSSTPHVGSIAQTSYGGFGGHVAYVEAVSPDGSEIKYSDMNGIAGWGRVGYSGWVPVSKFEHYISR